MLGSPLVTWSDFKVGDACFGQLPEGDDHGLLYIGQPALHIAPSLQPLENRRSPNGRVDIAIKYTVAMQLLELQAIKPARMFDAPHQIIFPVTFCRGTFSCSGESIARISLVNTGGPPGSAGGPLANSNLQCSNLVTPYSPTHPHTHPLTHSLTHPPTHSLTHPLTHSPTHTLTWRQHRSTCEGEAEQLEDFESVRVSREAHRWRGNRNEGRAISLLLDSPQGTSVFDPAMHCPS